MPDKPNSNGPSTSLEKSPREERLAAKLRENLRRRKSQAREKSDSGEEALPKTGGES